MEGKKGGKSGIDKYLVLLAIICIIIIGYYIALAYYRYVSFDSEYYDIGVASYSIYLHIYYPSITSGLQYLSFYNHISPFTLLIVPIFALFQSPMTLIVLQEISLAAAAILLYLCGKDILKNRMIGFSLGLAFILNLGVRGIMLWDFHPEGFIPFLFILAFYLYMKDRLLGFAISYVLILSTMETSWPVGASLILGLLYYEFVYNSKKDGIAQAQRSKRIKLMCAMVGITVAFALFYYFAIHSLLNMYQQGLYPNLPPQLRVIDYSKIQFTNLSNSLVRGFKDNTDLLIAVFGLCILFLGFGISSFADPLLTALFIYPWLFEVFILHNLQFAALYFDYYSFAVGGSAVAAILGMLIIFDKKALISKLPIKIGKDWQIKYFVTFILCISIVAYLLISPPVLPLYSKTIYGNYTQIEAELKTIPTNANVMLQANLYPHLYYIEHLEFSPNTTFSEGISNGVGNATVNFYWFKPNYVVLYPTRTTWFAGYNSFDNSTFNVYEYMGKNFTLYNSTDGVEIYKRNNP